MTPVPGYTAAKRTATIGFPDVAAAAALCGIYSYAVYYLFNHGAAYLQPNYTYALVYLAGAFVYMTNHTARRALSEHTSIIALWIVLIVLMSIQYVFFEISSEGMGLFTGRMHFLVMLVATLLIFSASASLERIIAILGLVVAGVSALNIFEFFFAGNAIEWMSNVPGRAAGFYENANDSAMFICLAVPLVAMQLKGAWRIGFYLITFAGVYLTFSRGGLALFAFVVSLVELVLSASKPGWAVRAVILSAFGLSALVTLSFLSDEMSRVVTELLWPYLDSNTAARIEFLSNDSTNERMVLLEHGLDAFAAAPLFGNGVGYTHAWDASASTHNLFVLMLAEMGLVGGIWMLAFVYVLWTYPRPYGGFLAALVAMSALFSHNHLERPALAMLLALYFVTAQAHARRSRAARS